MGIPEYTSTKLWTYSDFYDIFNCTGTVSYILSTVGPYANFLDVVIPAQFVLQCHSKILVINLLENEMNFFIVKCLHNAFMSTLRH